ncbi:MAG: hypothetical protein ACK5WZ_09075 [Pseudobdellovibrionaceae bacterium]
MKQNRISRKLSNKYHQGNPWSSAIPIVAEQPGIRIAFFGIVLSVVLSFMIQGYFSQNRVEEQFRPLLRQIHPQLVFDFKSIRLSLRDGFLPRTAMVMDQVQIVINNKCLINTRTEIDQVILPFSILGYFLGENPISEIHLGHVKADLATSDLNCAEVNTNFSGTTPSEETAAVLFTSQPKVTIAESVSKVDSSSEIQKVTVSKFEVFRNNSEEPILSVNDLIFNLLSGEPKHISLSSKLNLFQENKGIDYFSKGELEAQYREFPEKKIDLSLVGHVREGGYRIEASLLLETMNFRISSDIQHIPVYPFVDLMRKLEMPEVHLPTAKMWTSFQAHAEGSFKNPQSTKMTIKPIILEGEFGSISSESISVQNLAQPEFLPFKLVTSGLSLDQMLDEKFKEKNFPFIQNLGIFQGYFQYIAKDQFYVSGIHNGLQFIFSNLGQRKIQKIDNLILNITAKDEVWNFDIPRLDLQNGIFDGAVQLYFSPKDKTLELKCDVNEIVFSEEVQKVMTDGGYIGGASISYQGKWKDLALLNQSGNLKISGSNIYGIQISKASAKLT